MTSRIVIAGAGPIGLSFAIAAARLANTEVTVIERQTLALTGISSQFDHRVYALSPGSKAFLASIGVWQKMPATRIEAVRGIEVWGDETSTMDSHVAFEEGTPLAYIVEHASLMNALIETARECTAPNFQLYESAAMTALNLLAPARSVTCADGSIHQADLIIAADGARSQLRTLAGLDAEIFDYAADGVVANFTCEKSHGDVARQWFDRDAVLAYLPLPNKQISIVWSAPHTRAAALAALNADAFAEAVADAGRRQLGALTLTSAVARFPLRRVLARDWVLPGFAMIGDAAHAIHPMAGQGANLGFADAATLLGVLNHRSNLSGVGDLAVLRRYARARREDAVSMGAATHGLHLLYGGDAMWLKRLRNQGLGTVNRLPLAKSLLMAHAMR